jgi:hypothetical protein
MGTLKLFSRDCLPLDQVVKLLESKTFVETGCFYGDSLDYAMQVGFTECYSCDIDPQMIEICNNRFKNSQVNVTITQESSVEFLTNLMPKIQHNPSVVFFLDAHLFGFDKSKGSMEVVKDDFTFPLEKELDIIYQHRKDKQDIIICDDLRIYEDDLFENGVWADRHQFGLNLDFISKYQEYSVKKFTNQEGYLLLSRK